MNNEMLPKLLPKIRAKTWRFKDKQDPSKLWYGWEIEVGGKDSQNLPVTFIHLESHQLKPPRLYHTEEGARKDLAKHVTKVEGIVKRAFENPGAKVIAIKSRLRGAFE